MKEVFKLMLVNYNIESSLPKRIVILGKNGFIASSVKKKLFQINCNVLALGKDDIDLTRDNSSTQLASILNKDDTLLFISAIAPVKDINMFQENIKICKNVCDALNKIKIKHLVYISSDAVYKDSMSSLSETSSAEPDSMHGLMHITREKMLKSNFEESYCILRPTLIYGSEDPHNGYGPNQFIRSALKKKDIELFGKGEELRDHVWIEDVSEIIKKSIIHMTHGTLNIATGNILSFYEIANSVIKCINSNLNVNTNPRNSPMPHDGYRSFNPSMIINNFKDFRFSKFDDVLKKIYKDYK